MLRIILFVSAFLVFALAIQVPLDPGQSWKDDHPLNLGDDNDVPEWSLHKCADPDTTDHLVFETVNSLLRRWSNTRMRNGHTIVPGVIQNGTLLYRGWFDDERSTGPDWVALDPEQSYLYCRNSFGRPSQLEGGWHCLTYMVTRPLRVLYFDGSSAVKLSFGSMDTQDLMTWGKPSRNDHVVLEEETKRIQDLCEWGKQFDVDGFVRMDIKFEVILCDFTSGVNMVSFNYLWDSQVVPKVSPYEWFNVLNAGIQNNGLREESRIQLDLAQLVSFYDTQLAPSLVPIRGGQERWDHRAIHISNQDLSAVKSRLEANLMASEAMSSGVDWKILLQIVVNRYAQRLEMARNLLSSSTTNADDILELVKIVHLLFRSMLVPHILFSATSTESSDKMKTDWAIPTYKHCATTYTHSMESMFGSMTDSEKLILQAIRGTNREICRVLTKMWVAGVYAGIDPLLNTEKSVDIDEVARVRNTWTEELGNLMSWLDWHVWVRCDPDCGPEETCYLPTWPVGFPWSASKLQSRPVPMDDISSDQRIAGLLLRRIILSDFAREVHNVVRPDSDEWIRPQPRCIPIKSYRF